MNRTLRILLLGGATFLVILLANLAIQDSHEPNPAIEQRLDQINQRVMQQQHAESQQRMAQSQQLHQQRMASNQAAFDAHQQRMQTLSGIGDMQMQSWQTQQRSSDEMHRRTINGINVGARFGDEWDAVERDAVAVAATLGGALGAGIVHKHLAHRLGGDAEEVGAVVPFAGGADELLVGPVDERAEFVVDQRQQAAERSVVPVAHLFEEGGNVLLEAGRH